MRAAASKRGITITSRSRPLNPDDIEEFDLLICMVRIRSEEVRGACVEEIQRDSTLTYYRDAHALSQTKDGSNKSAVMEAADHWGLTQQAASKIKLMCDYCTRHTDKKGGVLAADL